MYEYLEGIQRSLLYQFVGPQNVKCITEFTFVYTFPAFPSAHGRSACPEPALPDHIKRPDDTDKFVSRLLSLSTSASAHRRHSSEGEGGCGEDECA